ncbi:MAG: hypothetical protein ACFNL1_02725, partial [Prevotella histicola]
MHGAAWTPCYNPVSLLAYSAKSTSVNTVMVDGRILMENGELKNIAQVKYTRHRCFDKFIVNLFGAIAAYYLFPKKPCINVQRTIDTQLALF